MNKKNETSSVFRIVSRKYLVQALSPYFPELQLGGLVHEYLDTSFVSTWQVGGRYKSTLFLPLESDGKYDFTVVWGDGKHDHITSFDQAETSHEYTHAGRYTIQLNGLVEGFSFNFEKDGFVYKRPCREQILDISQWGCLGLSNQGHQFEGCINLNQSAQDVPNLTSVTNLSYMFCNASVFNGDASNWDTSACTDMRCMFYDASSFNGDISRWNTSACTNMVGMFYRASLFNGDVSKWNTAACTKMTSMFRDASAFNGDVSNWSTSACTNMASMFRDAIVFNGDVSGWNTASCTDMRCMFYRATSYTGDVIACMQ